MKINNQKLLSLSIAGLIAFSAGSKDKESEYIQVSGKPNIVIIVPDDLGGQMWDITVHL